MHIQLRLEILQPFRLLLYGISYRKTCTCARGCPSSRIRIKRYSEHSEVNGNAFSLYRKTMRILCHASSAEFSITSLLRMSRGLSTWRTIFQTSIHQQVRSGAVCFLSHVVLCLISRRWRRQQTDATAIASSSSALGSLFPLPPLS